MNTLCRYYLNQRHLINTRFEQEDYFLPSIIDFHRSLPGYKPTPLLHLRGLSSRLGVGEILVKDESTRFEVGAFKSLGASWAIHSLLKNTTGKQTFCTATDGNHGRAVAWSARIMGHKAIVFVPFGTVKARIENIRKEGAMLIEYPGNYDETVAAAREEAGKKGYILVQDSSWEGYTRIPMHITAGYTTMMLEIENELLKRESPPFDAVILQSGVGSWAASVALFVYARYGDKRPLILVTEPTEADCLLESAAQKHLSPTRNSQKTIMAGLNCGTPSMEAWKILEKLTDAFIAVPDEYAMMGIHMLSKPLPPDPEIETCESGAAGIGTLAAIMHSESLSHLRSHFLFGPSSRFLIFNTEGITDPVLFHEILKNKTLETDYYGIQNKE